MRRPMRPSRRALGDLQSTAANLQQLAANAGFSGPALATNYTVKAGGGGSFTTMSACATQMSTNGTGVSDTCTVFAGTYNESVTVPAGSAGNYKIFTVNGSDVVSVLGFTLGSHNKLIGNCPTLQGTVTTATCGFFVSNTASPTTNCVSMSNGTTDVYIRLNTMYACGGIGNAYPISVSYIYVQGNTVSYTNSTTGTVPTTCSGAGSPVGNSINLYGNHILVENNDFSHYTISLAWNVQNSITRNNNFHDTVEANNAGNCHSDTWFSEPGVSVNDLDNVYEGNLQYNAGGPNAKGQLSQGESCGGTCSVLIERFNSTSGIGGGNVSNDTTWDAVKVYNNTWTAQNASSNFACGNTTTDNSVPNTGQATARSAYLNNIYYYTNSAAHTGCVNAYQCSTTSGSSCSWGYSLAFCTVSGGCGTVYGHLYQTGTFASEPGQQIADPKFVNYVSDGSLSNNYNLRAGSPAIASGTYLTTIAAGDTGTGTSLIVNDAAYFQDGYGLTNAYSTVNGDCISVTTATNHVCVTAVNYTTNTLTLASSISRSAGQGVYLYNKSDGVQVLTGSAPDIGAYPYNAAPPASTPGVLSILSGDE
ncbi:MAG: hypothetical protein ACYC7B_04560 [Burkholderiales bacterium]